MTERILPEHYNVAEAAEASGLSQTYIRKKMALGELPVYKFGGSGQYRILREDLQQLLVRVEVPGAWLKKEAG